MFTRTVAMLAALLLLSSPAFAKETQCFVPPGAAVNGTINHYVDGDTFDIAPSRFRTWGIDATEEGDFGYSEAAQALRSLTQGRLLTCQVKYHDTTRKPRCVAVCNVSGVGDLGDAMLRTGWVKIHPRYINEDATLKARYVAAQIEARATRRGLWR